MALRTEENHSEERYNNQDVLVVCRIEMVCMVGKRGEK